MATTTTNFNLNIVDGSDIVNPLIYDNPNYQKIDEQMFKNQNAGIQKANYAKSGTVHQITRVVPTANVFYFIASANYNVGDTFTVDGGTVTATLPNGAGLQTNAFVINANVVCVLNGTALTVLVPADVSQTVNFAETAGKLATPVNIGNASFDGSANITLAQIGAMPTQLTGDITPITAGSAQYVKNIQGGYLQIGKLVFVSVAGQTVQQISGGSISVGSGLPTPNIKYTFGTDYKVVPISAYGLHCTGGCVSDIGVLAISKAPGEAYPANEDFFISGFYYTN